MYDLDIQIREYIDATSEPLTVDEVHHVTVGEDPVRPITLRDGGQRSRRGWLIAAAAAAAALVLIGGFGLLVRVVNETDDAPVVDDPVVTTTQPVDDDPVVTTTQPVDTSTTAASSLEEVVIEVEAPWAVNELPADAVVGAVDTPLGPVNWVQMTDNSDTLPDDEGGRFAAVKWPSGFAIFQAPNHSFREGVELSVPAQLWVSADGVEWRREALPLDPSTEEASLTLDSGTYWLASMNPNGLWRSTDGTTWHEYDPSDLATPGPGWHSNGVIAPPVTAGDVTLTYGNFNNDHNNSNTISDLHEERLYIIEVGGITRVDVPWPTFDNVAQGYHAVTLFAANESVYAYLLDEIGDTDGSVISSEIVVWRTEDGRAWTNLGPLTLPDLPPSHSAWFRLVGDSLTVTFFDTSEASDSRDAAWETTDGVKWSPLPGGRPDGTHPWRTESGWFATTGDIGGPIGGQNWWMNVGDTWVSLAEIGHLPCDGSTITAVVTTTFMSCRSDPTTMWALNFEPSN